MHVYTMKRGISYVAATVDGIAGTTKSLTDSSVAACSSRDDSSCSKLSMSTHLRVVKVSVSTADHTRQCKLLIMTCLRSSMQGVLMSSTSLVESD